MDARTVRRPIKARKGTWKAAWEAGRGAPLACAFWLVQTLFVRSTAQTFVAKHSLSCSIIYSGQIWV